MFYLETPEISIGPFKTFGSVKSWMKKNSRTGTICQLTDPGFEASTQPPLADEHVSNKKEPSQAGSLTTEPTKPSPKS